MSDELLITAEDTARAREWFNQAVADGLIRRGSVKDYPLVQMLAAHRHAAEVATREQCAKIADDYGIGSWGMTEEQHAAEQIAIAIRASHLRMEVE